MKNMTVSAIDLRLGRVSLVRTDITNSVREQQGLLNVIAYTFERLGLIDVKSGRVTLYTRRSVLENLPPETLADYPAAVGRFLGRCGGEADGEEARRRLRLEGLLAGLAERPAGFDFVLPCRTEEGPRYKQVNVLWGDENHQTVCLVLADVTAMLAAERESKRPWRRPWPWRRRPTRPRATSSPP